MYTFRGHLPNWIKIKKIKINFTKILLDNSKNFLIINHPINSICTPILIYCINYYVWGYIIYNQYFKH